MVVFLGFPLTVKGIDASAEELGSTQKKLLLFVHGIFGSPEGTWQNFPDLVKNDPSLGNEFDVDFHKYPSTYWCSGVWYLPTRCVLDVETLADALGTQINNQHRAYNEIVLATHSLGGIVTMTYLISEVESNRELRVSKILLFAVPTSGSELAALAKTLIPWYIPLIEQLKPGAGFMQELAIKWLQLKMAERVKAKYVFASLDQVIVKKHIKLLWGDFETVHKSHMGIVKPIDPKDLSFVILRNFLLD